ncbi:MAG: hypothetical protein FJX77_08325 [Armatimonadetes bacterium]|nr:hypothetical protein [Armatimonadota bacterium]
MAVEGTIVGAWEDARQVGLSVRVPAAGLAGGVEYMVTVAQAALPAGATEGEKRAALLAELAAMRAREAGTARQELAGVKGTVTVE